MGFWQVFGLIAITNLLMAMLSFEWGYIKGQLETIEIILKATAEEERRRTSND